MPNDNVISLIARQATQLPLPLPDPVAQAATELREVLADFGMQLKIWYRTMEGLAERLVLVARDEARPRILYESMNVLEGHMPLMRRQSMQCLRCIRHSSCVASDRQGMKCLAYFLTLDYQNEFDFYRCIPLTIDALNMVDFHTLLLLCVIHQVNFDVIDQFTLVNLRAHLILCVGHLDTAS